MNKIITLIGGIGEYSISHDYVRYMLEDCGNVPVTVKCTSPGGDLNQALLIKALFEEHGNVTVEYCGFNASAATILGHGAVKTLIREDSMYLVHKPSMMVDVFERMNEDDLTELLAELEGQKKDAEKITVMIAQDYVNSRGMEMSKVIQLMTDARWLTGKEAVELGLVDELIASTKKQPIVTNEVLAMMSANGFPVPVMETEEAKEETFINKIINRITNPKTTTMTMNKDFSFVNSVLGVDGVEMKGDVVSMTVAQMTALNAKLEKRKNDVVTMAAKFKEANDNKTVAENSVVELTAQLEVANTALATRPGVAAAKPQGESGANNANEDTTDWDTINNLPHNKAVDSGKY